MLSSGSLIHRAEPMQAFSFLLLPQLLGDSDSNLQLFHLSQRVLHAVPLRNAVVYARIASNQTLSCPAELQHVHVTAGVASSTVVFWDLTQMA